MCKNRLFSFSKKKQLVKASTLKASPKTTKSTKTAGKVENNDKEEIKKAEGKEV